MIDEKTRAEAIEWLKQSSPTSGNATEVIIAKINRIEKGTKILLRIMLEKYGV